MKVIKFSLLAALFAVASLAAAPLTETVAVYLKPDASTPTYTYFKSGSEPVPASGVTAATGWVAVELPGPHEVFIHNKNITKDLTARPGTEYHTKPDANSPVVATAEKSDTMEITGMAGAKKEWARLQLTKNLIGYYKLPSASPKPASAAPAATQPATPSPAAANAPSSTAFEPGRPAPTSSMVDSNLIRLFEGKIASSRGFLGIKKPYEFQLNDGTGNRLAYLNLAKLLLTEQPDSYVGHTVTIYGMVHPLPNGNGLVIDVESLQLK